MQIDAEFQALIPPLAADELAQLERNLVADGCREPLVVWRGVLLDGHNRHAICTRLAIPFATVEVVGVETRADAALWIIRNQLGRRNLTDFVRASLALQAKPLIEAAARARMESGANQYSSPSEILREGSGRTSDTVAGMAGISGRTVDKVEAVLEHGSPELIEAAKSGAVSVSTAADIATLPKAEQAEIVKKGDKAYIAAAKSVRAEKAKKRREERIEEIAQVSAGNAELPTLQRYPVIYADPPWRYEYVETESRAVENHHPTMSLDELCALPVADLAFADSVLFLWATSPKLADALRLIAAWGFEYRTCAVWDKEIIGMGYYYRQRHELLLVATRGQLPAPQPDVRPASVVCERRGPHSAKPAVFAEQIEAMYPELPKIELFCRSPRPGWAVWGNQSGALAA